MTDPTLNVPYRRAVEFLYRLRWFGAKFGLENTFKLAALAGNPHHRLRFIHVAGTNGKGSTCAMLESIYRAAGFRVGLFTSPHLVSFRERIQVNRQWISEADVIRLAGKLQSLLEEFPQEHHPTFFETVTVMALCYFAERKCDLVIWETGLGGRLDATNIVTPLASVITNIQYDHQQWLGETLTSIAREKAGIIKPRIPVITATADPEALDVIEQTAREQEAPLTKASPTSCWREPNSAPVLPLVGRHQLVNAALAVTTVETLQPELPVPKTAVRTGLATVDWPGRLQLIARPGGQRILFDGAHNVAGAETLAEALKTHFHPEKATMILGILADKDAAGMCALLAPLAQKILVVPVLSERTTAPADLAALCKTANPDARVVPCASLSAAWTDAARDPFVIVTGSLYLVGEATQLLELSPTTTGDEHGLNEWCAGRAGPATKVP